MSHHDGQPYDVTFENGRRGWVSVRSGVVTRIVRWSDRFVRPGNPTPLANTDHLRAHISLDDGEQVEINGSITVTEGDRVTVTFGGLSPETAKPIKVVNDTTGSIYPFGTKSPFFKAYSSQYLVMIRVVGTLASLFLFAMYLNGHHLHNEARRLCAGFPPAQLFYDCNRGAGRAVFGFFGFISAVIVTNVMLSRARRRAMVSMQSEPWMQ